eukprot:jgi/Ulvmu1/4395/UM002_0120.1
MLNYDSGYDTDDTDELLAQKSCAQPTVYTVPETALRARPSTQNCQPSTGALQPSVIVNEDWLFSLGSTRECTDSQQYMPMPAQASTIRQCPETAARREMGFSAASPRTGPKEAPCDPKQGYRTESTVQSTDTPRYQPEAAFTEESAHNQAGPPP